MEFLYKGQIKICYLVYFNTKWYNIIVQVNVVVIAKQCSSQKASKIQMKTQSYLIFTISFMNIRTIEHFRMFMKLIVKIELLSIFICILLAFWLGHSVAITTTLHCVNIYLKLFEKKNLQEVNTKIFEFIQVLL